MTVMTVMHAIALGLLAILGWGVFVLFGPYRQCRWCRRKRGPRCWRCKGTRLTRRLGAYHVHKVRLSLVQAWQERGSRK